MKKIVLFLVGAAGMVIAYSVLTVTQPQYAYSNGQVCGGFGGETRQFKCPLGFKCQYSERGADSQGKCVLSPLFTLNELRLKYIK